MSIYVDAVAPGTLPEGYYQMALHGLPGYPKTAAGIEGRDIKTGEMWQTSIWVNPRQPVDSLPILVPLSVPFTRVVTADEMLDEATTMLFQGQHQLA